MICKRYRVNPRGMHTNSAPAPASAVACGNSGEVRVNPIARACIPSP